MEVSDGYSWFAANMEWKKGGLVVQVSSLKRDSM